MWQPSAFSGAHDVRRLRAAPDGRVLGPYAGQSGLSLRALVSELGRVRCLTFGAKRLEQSVAVESMQTVEPLAVEAAAEAERRHQETKSEQRRLAELELTQARCEASLAERPYAAAE